MTDFVTIVLNEKLLTELGYFSLFCVGVSMVALFMDLIRRALEENTKAKKRKIYKPYRITYIKLLKEQKYREALDYAGKYGQFVHDNCWGDHYI